MSRTCVLQCAVFQIHEKIGRGDKVSLEFAINCPIQSRQNLTRIRSMGALPS